MKKHLLTILGLFMICNLSACGSSESVQTSNSEKAAVTVKEEKTPAPTKEPEKKKSLTIEGQVLYEENGIKVTLKDTEITKPDRPELPILIENDSELPICVQARNISVNGIMYDVMLSEDVVAGKKANATISFYNYDGRYDAKSIGEMEFSLHIFNGDTWDTIRDTDQIVLKTSDASYEYEPDMSGEVLYENNGIKIIYQGMEEDWSGLNVLLYAENNSDRPICIQTRDTSINGFMIDAIMSEEIMPGKKSYTKFDFLDSYLKENELTKDNIEEIELYFHIFDNETWNTIEDTGIITINV